MKPLDFISVSELSKLIRNKEVSPTELLDSTLKKIEKLDPILNSFAFLDIEGAKSLAKESEKRMMSNSLLSELDGIPTSIKDLIAQKNLAGTWALEALRIAAGVVREGFDFDHKTLQIGRAHV